MQHWLASSPRTALLRPLSISRTWRSSLLSLARSRQGRGNGWTYAAATAFTLASYDQDEASRPAKDEDTHNNWNFPSIDRPEQADRQRKREGLINAFHHCWLRWIWEPLCTYFRFIELLALFTPVLFTTPLLLIGFRDVDGDRTGARWWFRYLAITMEIAGPSFIKLGQWAASRSDIFPIGLCKELGKLHSNSHPHGMPWTRNVVESAAGLPFNEIFDDFETKPLGVGAMGQVYRAYLRGRSSPVAVKVLHPHIEKVVNRDLAIMGFLAQVANAIPTMEWLSLPGEVSTFGQMMRSQMDLSVEANNLETFRANFAHRIHEVSFPDVVFSSREVLVEGLVNGVSMERILKHCKQGPLDRRIATLGLDAFLQMLLIDNFIHSDLHPGNMFVCFLNRPDITQELNSSKTEEEWRKIWHRAENSDLTPQLYFIDAGLVTRLDDRNRRNFIDLFKAIAMFDGYRAGELMIERSRTPSTALDTEIFALRTQKLVDQVKRRTFALGSVKLGDLLTSMMNMVRAHHVRMESDYITVVLSILLLEGIGRKLNPDLDIFKSALPILREVSANLQGSDKEDILQMAKVWLALEMRQFINASVQDIYRCVKYDRLSPNH